MDTCPDCTYQRVRTCDACLAEHKHKPSGQSAGKACEKQSPPDKKDKNPKELEKDEGRKVDENWGRNRCFRCDAHKPIPRFTYMSATRPGKWHCEGCTEEEEEEDDGDDDEE